MKIDIPFTLITIIVAIVFCSFTGKTQTSYQDFKGAIYEGQSGAAVLKGSPMAIYTNPADLIFAPNFAISASAKNFFFGVDDVWSGILASSFALSKHDAIGIGITSLGNSASRYSTLSASYAHKLARNMGIGVTFNGHHYSVMNYESMLTGSIDIGFRAAVYPYLHLEASIHNPYEIGDIEYKDMNSSLNIQILYEITKNIGWTTAFKKNWNNPLSLHTGLSFRLIDDLVIYAGGGVAPSQIALGLRYNMGKMHFITSSRYQTPLGFSPSVELGYKSD